MAARAPRARPSRGASSMLAAALPEAGFPKEPQLQTATISLWTVVGAVQAMERTVEAHALRLLSLEQRTGTVEKRFAACEKALAEMGSQLESRGVVLGTLLQEYGLLQRRLENMENLLKNQNFWVLRVPASSSGEAAKGSAALDDISSHFPHEKRGNSQAWQKDLVKGNGESLIPLDFAVSKLESLTCTEEGNPPCSLPQADLGEEAQEPSTHTGQEPSAVGTEVISWIKREAECGRDQGTEPSGGPLQRTCNYYTVSKLDCLPSDGDGVPSDIPFRTDLGPEANTVSVAQKRDLPGSRTDLVSWIEAEEQASIREGRDGHQSTSNRHLLPTEEHQPEDPANPPLLLFFPGGSVAPICNGTIGESHPFPSLHSACTGHRASENNPSSLATATEAAMDRPHTCLECGKTFSLLLSLQIHQMNHQKQQHYECSYCRLALGCLSELVRHEMIHTRERPYKCTVCGKGFVRKQHLVPHLRLHTGERPYHCGECGKDFICKHHLLEHQRTHTGERPYACTGCGKAFRRKKSLKDHVRIHRVEHGQLDLAQGLPDELQNITSVGTESARLQKAGSHPIPKASPSPMWLTAPS